MEEASHLPLLVTVKNLAREQAIGNRGTANESVNKSYFAKGRDQS